MDYQNIWKEELEQMIALLRKTELVETTKWGIPVFTYNKRNVVGLAGFKEHVAIWFYDGVYLNDKYNRLINASEGKTKALRQLRFTKEDVIDENLIRYYLDQAIINAKKGIAHVPEKSKEPIQLPELLKQELNQNSVLKEKFSALTPFKQKEYIEYISEAKQENTKLTRLEKIKPMILNGIGLNDKYR